MKTRTLIIIIVVAAAGFAAGYLGRTTDMTAMPAGSDNTSSPEDSGERKIKYWVAPMDPNFRRDGPGKSPMGMDLVPVYADEGGGDVIEIQPHVVQNLGVRTVAAERGRLWKRIDTVGYVDYDEDHISHIHLRTDGWIERLYVKSDGAVVKKGEVLFEVYSRELVSAQEEYLQAVRSNNSYLETASRERLVALGMSPEQIAEVRGSGKVAQRVRYHAQQDGFVDELSIREGMYVQPMTEVMALADLSSVWILVDVFERQADWVKVGKPADVSLSYAPGVTLEGRVEFIYPSIDPQTRTLRVRLRFDNPDELLKPNMYANVVIYAGPKKDILIIPREALIRTGDMDRVAVALGDGRFEVREVVAGMESGDSVEIQRGLSAGDRVVTSGQFLIDSEASIRGTLNRLGPAEDAPDKQGPVMGSGTVNAIMADERKLNVTHAPIEALGWPDMTMDFRLTDNADISDLKQGDSIHFTLSEDTDGYYRIDSIHVMPQGD